MELLKPAEVAKILRVATITTYKWAERGILPSYHLEGCVRFDREDVLEFVRSRRRETVKRDTTRDFKSLDGQNG